MSSSQCQRDPGHRGTTLPSHIESTRHHFQIHIDEDFYSQFCLVRTTKSGMIAHSCNPSTLWRKEQELMVIFNYETRKRPIEVIRDSVTKQNKNLQCATKLSLTIEQKECDICFLERNIHQKPL